MLISQYYVKISNRCCTGIFTRLFTANEQHVIIILLLYHDKAIKMSQNSKSQDLPNLIHTITIGQVVSVHSAVKVMKRQP